MRVKFATGRFCMLIYRPYGRGLPKLMPYQRLALEDNLVPLICRLGSSRTFVPNPEVWRAMFGSFYAVQLGEPYAGQVQD